MLFCRFLSITHFIAYFLKKKYSLWQNILKNLRVWERSLTSVLIVVYLGLIEVGTWLGTGSAKEHWRFAEKGDRTLHRTLDSSVRSVHRRWIEAQRSDRTLKQCSSCVRSDGGPTSSQAKKVYTGSTELWLCPVKGNRTLPVVTWGDLDLSVVDRTLGGSVRSLPPERPVSRNHARSELSILFPFLFYLGATI